MAIVVPSFSFQSTDCLESSLSYCYLLKRKRLGSFKDMGRLHSALGASIPTHSSRCSGVLVYQSILLACRLIHVVADFLRELKLTVDSVVVPKTDCPSDDLGQDKNLR